jgi:HSP20 family protein
MFAIATHPRASYGHQPLSLLDAMVADWLTQRPQEMPRPARARIEVSERDDRYEVRAELPGASKDGISVDIDGTRVSINAQAATASEHKDGEKVIYTERRHESFARSFDLPQAVNSDAAQAKFEDGVLRLTLPKLEAAKVRRLTVQ